jgi:hypothetical protein
LYAERVRAHATFSFNTRIFKESNVMFILDAGNATSNDNGFDTHILQHSAIDS